MAEDPSTCRGSKGTPLAASEGVIIGTREMLVDGAALIRETIRRNPSLLIGAFLLSAFLVGVLTASGRRR